VKNRSWALVDQTLSSISNLVPGIYAAHVLSPSDFGLFALIQVAYVLALGVTRVGIVEPAVISGADIENRPTKDHLGAVDGVHIVAAGGALLGGATLALVADAPAALMWLSMAGLAIALGQDALRMVSISIGRARDAAVNDGLWVLSLLAALPVAAAVGLQSLWGVTAMWVLAAVPGWLFAVVRTGWLPNARRGAWHGRRQARLTSALLVEWGLKQGATQLATYGIGMLGGLTVVAGVRAAQLVLGPLNILFTGLQTALLPESVRSRQTDLSGMRAPLRRLSLLLGTLSLLAGIAFSLLPEAFLQILVGDQSNGLAVYVMPMAAILASTGFMTGAHLGLRALAAGRELVSTRFLGSLTTLGTALLGLVVWDFEPLAGLWGLACGGMIAALLWERAFARAYRAARSHPAAQRPGREAHERSA
jgi:O-antigen/teichoic acid export membrane protein